MRAIPNLPDSPYQMPTGPLPKSRKLFQAIELYWFGIFFRAAGYRCWDFLSCFLAVKSLK
jgi:hypothetical protein